MVFPGIVDTQHLFGTYEKDRVFIAGTRYCVYAVPFTAPCDNTRHTRTLSAMCWCQVSCGVGT